jgi:hypothetical protein
VRTTLNCISLADPNVNRSVAPSNRFVSSYNPKNFSGWVYEWTGFVQIIDVLFLVATMSPGNFRSLLADHEGRQVLQRAQPSAQSNWRWGSRTPTAPSTATPRTHGAALELLAMRWRLMKTQRSMKQRGVSAFSRAYWYMRMRSLGNNSSIHSDVCSRTELKMLTVLMYFLYSWLLQIEFLPIMEEVSHLVASTIHLVSN